MLLDWGKVTHSDLDLWLPKSNQFILGSKWTFRPNLKKIPQGVLKYRVYLYIYKSGMCRQTQHRGMKVAVLSRQNYLNGHFRHFVPGVFPVNQQTCTEYKFADRNASLLEFILAIYTLKNIYEVTYKVFGATKSRGTTLMLSKFFTQQTIFSEHLA